MPPCALCLPLLLLRLPAAKSGDHTAPNLLESNASHPTISSLDVDQPPALDSIVRNPNTEPPRRTLAPASRFQDLESSSEFRSQAGSADPSRSIRPPRDFFAHPRGSDAKHVMATFASPLATVQACVDRLQVPGDRCLLKAGTWSGKFSTVDVRGKHGTVDAPIVIAAAGDGPVVFDGTIPVDGRWTEDAGGRFRTNPPVPVYQMFAARKSAPSGHVQMQVPARWPNARFDDRSMYFGPEYWAHAGPKGTGAHNTRTHAGHFQDRGACNSTADCCSECNANDLAASGVNLTGGIAVLNLWGGGSAIQRVLHHTPGTNQIHYNATWVNPTRPSGALFESGVTLGDSYAGGRGRYYVEGPLQLLDTPGEWSYAADVLSWIPPLRTSVPSDYNVRVKNQTYAFQFYDSSHVVLANLSFFATTVCAHDDVGQPILQSGSGALASSHGARLHITSRLSYLTFESLDFDYPDCSKRMFGDTDLTWPTTRIWTDAMNNAGPDNLDAGGLSVPSSRIGAGFEACAHGLSKLCSADVKTMNTSLCLECVRRVSHRLSAAGCTVSKAEHICNVVRPECTAEFASKCGAFRTDREQCIACVAADEGVLYSAAANCTATAIEQFCGGVTPTPTPPLPIGPGGNRVPQYTNHRLIDLQFRYSDGIGLQAQGSGWSITNVKWAWNTWTGVAPARPDGSNGAVFLFNGMPNPDPKFGRHVSRLSFQYNGPSKAVKVDTSSKTTTPVLDLVDFAAELQTRDDGCFMETSGNNSAHLYQSWAHDSGKSASRFDGDYQGGTANGAFVKCVVWNNSGFVVKGDHHNVSFNTVFDGSDITVGQAAHSLPSLQTRSSRLTNISYRSITVETWDKSNLGKPTQANANTVFEGNLIDGTGPWKTHFHSRFTPAGGYNCTGSPDGKIAPFSGVFPDCPVNGQWLPNNVVGSWVVKRAGTPYDISEQLRDPWNRDFRPCPRSLAAVHGAGAYKVWSTADLQHWIPGAKDRHGTSQPSPRDGSVDVAVDADLIFLGAFRATGHTILLAEGGQNDSFAPLLEPPLVGENNVGHPKLKAGTHYAWRVDATMADGSTLLGPVWGFTTGHRLSCDNQCMATLRSLCSMDKVRAHSPFSQEPCAVCAGHLQHQLREARCTHAEIQEYCSSEHTKG